MTKFTRRDAIKLGVGATAVAGLAPLLGGIKPARAAATWNGAPEAGASIRILRWKQFIQAEFDKFAELTKQFGEKYSVKVRLDAESWEDIRPKRPWRPMWVPDPI